MPWACRRHRAKVSKMDEDAPSSTPPTSVANPERPHPSRRGAIAHSAKWVGVGIGLLLVFILSLSLIRIPAPQPLELQKPDAPGMGVGLTQVMQAEVDLLDPTPLFLPTKNNAGYAIGPRKFQMASQGNFQSFPPKLSNLVEGVELNFPPMVELPRTPADGLRVGLEPNPYRSLGQIDEKAKALSSRLGYLQIVPAGGGQTFALALSGVAEVSLGDWHPMEWMATIDRRGLVGNLALVVSSGVEECDAFFRRYLTEKLRMGGRLQPGIYRLRVGP